MAMKIYRWHGSTFQIADEDLDRYPGAELVAPPKAPEKKPEEPEVKSEEKPPSKKKKTPANKTRQPRNK